MPGWHIQEVSLSLGRQPPAVLADSPVGPHRHPFSLAHVHSHGVSHSWFSLPIYVGSIPSAPHLPLSVFALTSVFLTMVTHRPAQLPLGK